MIKYSCYSFEELSKNKIYEMLQLRSKVFDLEQQCLYQDMDGLDQKAYHILAENEDRIIGYSRIIKKGEYYSEFSSIGRVTVDEVERKKGVGSGVVEFSIKMIKKIFINEPIKISAQSYLIKFYENHGFLYKGENYLEDGIPHSAMFLY